MEQAMKAWGVIVDALHMGITSYKFSQLLTRQTPF